MKSKNESIIVNQKMLDLVKKDRNIVKESKALSLKQVIRKPRMINTTKFSLFTRAVTNKIDRLFKKYNDS